MPSSHDCQGYYARTAERFGGSVDLPAVLDFVDSGHDLINAADSYASDLIREIATECGVDFDEERRYDMKLLAVDIPMAPGPDQCLFLIGDEEEYNVGGALIANLRDPVIKAIATKEFEDLDKLEEEVDAERKIQEAERKHQEKHEKLEKEER